MTDDSTLLSRYVHERSGQAFSELVGRHVDLVYSAAVRRCNGDTHRAEDVVQTVFIALERNAESLVRHPALVAWLYTATRNAAANIRISEQRRARREQDSLMPDVSTSGHGDPDWSDVRRVLDDAMDELGSDDRKAVILRFFEKRSFADVGAAFDIPANTARVRTARALEKLGVLLRKRGVTSTAAALGGVISRQAVAAAPSELAGRVAEAALGNAPAGFLPSGASAMSMTAKAGLVTACALGVAALVWIVIHLNPPIIAPAPASENAAAEGSGDVVPGGSKDRMQPQPGRNDTTVPGSSRVPADDPRAREILQKMAAAYAALTSYADAGTVTVRREGLREPEQILFETRFVNPDRFRFSWHTRFFSMKSAESVVWSTEGQTRVRWGFRPEQAETMTRNRAVSVAMTVSGGAAYHVPCFFLDDRRSGQFSLAALLRAELAGEETVDGEGCFHVKAQHPRGQPYELWIAKRDFLLRKLVTEAPLSAWTAMPGLVRPPLKRTVYEEMHRDIQVGSDIPAGVFQEAPSAGMAPGPARAQ